ncbi:hypothetical protein [Chryseobacterium sp. FH1]|uniref:hypothetical protein n=1 Tax=Chryseobacterium sp. FH1 TaxID=1233951 RepID=UPI0004E398F3|nr:hypothetical protein [Chryseobacterium sp. FH1]KFC19383.1 hypothetical protein IO90_08770 [Chryseobacterium sp. FH1]
MNQSEDLIPFVKPYIELSQEEFEKVMILAESGIFASRIAEILQKDKRLFMLDWKRNGTPVFLAYYKGLEKAKADVNAKLLKKARKGNVTAAQQMEKIWQEQKLNDIKEEIFNSE